MHDPAPRRAERAAPSTRASSTPTPCPLTRWLQPQGPRPRRRSTDINRARQALVAIVVLLVTAAAVGASRAATIQPPAPTPSADQLLAHDRDVSTPAGTRFLAPQGWALQQGGDVTWLTPPEDDAWIVAIDARGADADAALQDAWTRLGRVPGVEVQVATTSPARDGWTHLASYRYATPAAENRLLLANVFGRDGAWTVFIANMPIEVADRRRSQLALVNGRILPPGGVRESFEGRVAKQLDAAAIQQLDQFVADARKRLGIPGVAMGIVQGGRVIHAGGQGVRSIASGEPVDARTRFLVASNTKAMTTMMLARLVDAGKLQWDLPVAQAWPGFRLGDDDTSRQVQVKHLVCACTGLPRQDYPWLMDFAQTEAEDVIARLRSVKPTTAFGSLYQYSNPLAAAGGYLGAHVAHPAQPLGVAYDQVMQDEVFDPLGMRDTTFDFDRALAGNHARPHARDVRGNIAVVDMQVNRSIVPLRPAGGAWSTVDDMLRFVEVELAQGRLRDGRRYIGAQALTARWAPQVALGADAAYGMGLVTETTGGVRTVQHGGSMIGFQTGMLWLPEHDVGIVLLTNADSGAALMSVMRRRLLEVLFDGQPRAVQELAASAARLQASAAAEHRGLQVPAADDTARVVEGDYRNADIGTIRVRRDGSSTVVDFGEWRSEVGTRRHADGRTSLVTIAPGTDGFELIVEGDADAPQLVLLEAQHRYVFERMPTTAFSIAEARP